MLGDHHLDVTEAACMNMKSNIILVILLSIISASIYLLQTFLFHKPEDTFFYLFQDLAFIPIQAIIVTLILNKLINIIEQKHEQKKINVIMSSFFSETGNALLHALSAYNDNQEELIKLLDIRHFKNKKSYNTMKKNLREFPYIISVTAEELEQLQATLIQYKPALLGLLQNANLYEHDTFTDMLWPIFHISDELNSRGDLRSISPAEVEHIRKDILRAYPRLVAEWVHYLKYLQEEYPYLFVTALRKNPFSQPVGRGKQAK